MKKLFLSLVAAVLAATATFAQNTLVATLTHGENVTMYYGTYALRDAHNAAESGDVINLSAGAFQKVDITKAVTLRGVGIDEAVPTNIVGEFTINIPSSDTNRFFMEGIRCQDWIKMRGTYDNPYFLKCQFSGFLYQDNPVIKNAMVVNCKITDGASLSGTSSAQFVNSYVRNPGNSSENTSCASFVNCIIRLSSRHHASFIKSSQLINCIFYSDYTNYNNNLPSTTIASNCVAINNDGKLNDLFNNSQANPGCGYAVYTQVFKDFTGTYSDSQTFELTDEAKTTFLGTDGTEVGLYGGVMPYTSTPSYPRITKMNVANKTTADGKLSVDIEVSAAQ